MEQLISFQGTSTDEYSRFLFAILCPDVKTVSVYKALCHTFSIFVVPAYIYSDRSAAFMSSDLKKYCEPYQPI